MTYPSILFMATYVLYWKTQNAAFHAMPTPPRRGRVVDTMIFIANYCNLLRPGFDVSNHTLAAVDLVSGL